MAHLWSGQADSRRYYSLVVGQVGSLPNDLADGAGLLTGFLYSCGQGRLAHGFLSQLLIDRPSYGLLWSGSPDYGVMTQLRTGQAGLRRHDSVVARQAGLRHYDSVGDVPGRLTAI